MMATATESTLQAKTIAANLTVDDLQQSLKFFEGLGFAVEDRWEEQGQLVGVMLRAGDARLGLMQDDWKKGRDRQKGVGMRLFIETKQDVDQIASRARAAGVKLDAEPHDTEWKTRAFEVTEPTGFKITVSSEM
jgi:predicted lactoylglutathione lyase